MGRKISPMKIASVAFVLCWAWVGSELAVAADVMLLGPDGSDTEDEMGQEVLNSSKMLPTAKEAENAYTTQAILHEYPGNSVCSGNSTTSKGTRYKVCVDAPEIDECPDDVWHRAFACSSCTRPEEQSCSKQELDVTFYW